jgi:hypothetical protein
MEVAFALVISFGVMVLNELVQRAAQRGLGEQDEFRQALLFYRADPSLRERVQIPTARRQLDRSDSTRLQRRSERGAEFGVPIVKGVALALKLTQLSFVALRAICCNPGFVRMPCDPGQTDAPALEVEEEQDIICHQSSPGEHFHGEKIDSC